MERYYLFIYLFIYFKQNSVTTEKMHNNNNLNTWNGVGRSKTY